MPTSIATITPENTDSKARRWSTSCRGHRAPQLREVRAARADQTCKPDDDDPEREQEGRIAGMGHIE